jgi:VWFA-related protein
VANASSPLRNASFAIALLVFLLPAPAQTSSPPDETGTRDRLVRLSSGAPEGLFRIDLGITDAAGNPVTDLAPGELTLLDNGQPSRIFTLDGSGPTSPEPVPELILVLDAVNLPASQFTSVQKAIARFLGENGGRLDMACMLYRLTRDGLYSSLKPIRDGNLLAKEAEQNQSPRTVWRADFRSDFGSLGSSESGSNRDQRSLRALGAIAIDSREVAGRKVVVWIGPGWPVLQGGENGFDEFTELSTRLREARITVDNITAWPNPESISGLFNYRDFLDPPRSPKTMQPQRMALPVLAIQTGGLVIESSDTPNQPAIGQFLDQEIERCAAHARSYYTITFSPPRTEQVDEYHDLGVMVARPGVTARAPAGYYNEPVYFDNPHHGFEKVAVAALEQIVHSETGLVRRLPNLELTERLSTPRLDALLTLVKGERERQALISLADLSLALPPPPDEIVHQPAPTIEEQQAILERTVDYLVNSIPKLPDFFAARNTMRYEEPPERNDESWKLHHADSTLRFATSEHATVLYRNGNEVVEKKAKLGKRQPATQFARNLETWGTFGPILSSVLSSATKSQSTLTWKRWERWKDGNVAVFSFNVPATANPLFEVTFCCLPEGNGSSPYHNLTGYLGEFAVDPTTGAITRIVITADLDEDRDPTVPIIRSQVMVEYGAQQLGGKVYFCPVRSVSISRGRSLRQLHEWAMSFRLYSYFETMINDVTFGGYHKFGSEARILAGFEESPENGPESGQNQPSKRAH